MEREDLLLRLLCALSMAERDGSEGTIQALTNMYNDLAAFDASLGSDPIINDIRLSVATLSYTLDVE